MKLKRYVLPGVIVVCVLVLLAAAAWYSSQPNWQPMPESLTKLPDVDRSRMPLGPYTVDFSSLIGGPTGEMRVAFFVVIRPGDVHLQRVGEVGRQLEGSAVMHIGVQYLAHRVPAQTMPESGVLVDGLRLHEGTLRSRPQFHTPGFEDATGQPIRVICSLFPKGLDFVARTHSFQGVNEGMCTAKFRPRPHLHASMGGIQPTIMPRMSSFLPEVYRLISERIQGEP